MRDCTRMEALVKRHRVRFVSKADSRLMRLIGFLLRGDDNRH